METENQHTLEFDSSNAIKWSISGDNGEYVLLLPVGAQLDEAMRALSHFVATMSKIYEKNKDRKKQPELAESIS
jgi:fatty acid/phospholipid biosynthesis enzyme